MKRVIAIAAAVGVLVVYADAVSAQDSTAKPPAQGSTAKPPAQGSTAKPPAQGSTAKPPAQGAPARGTAPAAAPRRSPGAGPIIVFETVKGTFEIETYPNEAPKTVEHILALVKRNFYNGLRIHRFEPGFVVQWGDPQTRDMTKKDSWGTGGSGTTVGVSEVSPKRPHQTGSVAAAYARDPRNADSQIYITLAPAPQLNKAYTVFGQVISGMDVVTQLRVPDVIRRATIKGATK
jgi:peptidyl-prolyl cis-trans isomerase B (cyclophilin B)